MKYNFKELTTIMFPQLIQLFADLGANGLLIEYEDMFPYEGELKVLQSTTQPPYRSVYSFRICIYIYFN